MSLIFPRNSLELAVVRLLLLLPKKLYALRLAAVIFTNNLVAIDHVIAVFPR
jgi:hypothetical protein